MGSNLNRLFHKSFGRMEGVGSIFLERVLFSKDDAAILSVPREIDDGVIVWQVEADMPEAMAGQ